MVENSSPLLPWQVNVSEIHSPNRQATMLETANREDHFSILTTSGMKQDKNNSIAHL